METSSVERQDWERHWHALGHERVLFSRLASLVRTVLLSRAVRFYAERFFDRKGLFLEAGCGTSDSSSRIHRGQRKLVGLDFSLSALQQARRGCKSVVCADIRHLPFRDGELSGIWNLGVMEHFHPDQAHRILREFRRILRPEGGALLLFWPPTFGLSRWVLAPFEWLRSLNGRGQFRFFPDEVNRLSSRSAARAVIEEAGLECVRVDFTPRDGLNHLIVVARRVS